MSDSPLEIPKLVITPSTPQTDPSPVPTLNSIRRLTLSVTTGRTLLDQIESSRPRGRKETQTHYLSPTSPTSRPQAHLLRRAGEHPRRGRGTAATLVFIAIAFLLVVTSALLSPETIAGLVPGKGRGWMVNVNDRVGAWETSQGTAEQVDNIATSLETSAEDSHTEHASEDAHAHTTTGPVMSNDAWKSYLRRRDQVTGQAGPTAHIEAWDFH